jgi:hypothetical protein
MFKSLTEPTHGSLHVRVAKKVTRHVGSLHIASFRCATEFGRHRGIADMAGLAAGLPRSRMTRNGQWAQGWGDLIDEYLALSWIVGVGVCQSVSSAQYTTDVA